VGTWITAEEATDPSYWARHLRQTVQFTAGISQLLQEPNRILLEVGPGLCTFALQHTEQAAGQVVLPSLRHPQDQQSDLAFSQHLRPTLAGGSASWSGFMLTSNVTVYLYQLTRLSASVTGLKRSEANPVRVKSSLLKVKYH